MALLQLRVPPGEPVRADRFLAAEIGTVSRRRVQALLESGRIRVRGRRIRKGELLPPGTLVDVDVVESPSEVTAEPDLDVPLLFDDDSVLALDKPAHMPSHALRPEDRGTIANFLAARHPETRLAGDKPLEHGVVHRLDTDTSGVLLVARTREAWRALRDQFRRREVRKLYVALVVGEVAGEGVIREPLEADPGDPRRVRPAARARAPGRSLLTRYTPIARMDGATLLQIDMESGFRHQIRAHLASIGHPVVGDRLYGAPPGGAGRHLLHAAAIEFTHPASGRRLRIESPLPPEFPRAGVAPRPRARRR